MQIKTSTLITDSRVIDMNAHIKRKIAIRKFFALPVTIIVGTVGAIFAAYIARLNLDLNSLYSNNGLIDYWLAVIIGVVFSTFFAYTSKEFLKSQGLFNMEYILSAMAFIVLLTCIVSFAANSVYFFSPGASITNSSEYHYYDSAPIYKYQVGRTIPDGFNEKSVLKIDW